MSANIISYIVQLNCDDYDVQFHETLNFIVNIIDYAHSGNSSIVFPMFLNRRIMSLKLAAVQKYCCFKRSSFPTE